MEIKKNLLTFVGGNQVTNRIMDNKQKIGKKVWLLDGSVYKGYSLKDKREFTVKAVKEASRCKDFCDHFVIEDEKGQRIEVKEYDVVVVFDGNFEKYLADNECYGEVTENKDSSVEVYIDWGDWKHDHGWCKDLMGYIDYEEIDEQVTEEDGSDCYSSVHKFAKEAK